MEAKMFTKSRSPFTTPSCRRRNHKLECSPILAILTRPPDSIAIVTGNKNMKPADGNTGLTQKLSVYHDNWFDRIAINHLSKSLQVSAGLRNSKSGYDSLVEAAEMVSRNFNPNEQREVVIHALERAFPRLILTLANFDDMSCEMIFGQDPPSLRDDPFECSGLAENMKQAMRDNSETREPNCENIEGKKLQRGN